MRNTSVPGCGSDSFTLGQLVITRRVLLTLLPAVMALLLTSGCSALQDQRAAIDLERQVARQQAAREMVHDVSVTEKRSAEDYEELGDRYVLRRDINRAYLYYLRGLEIEPERPSLLEKQAGLLLAKHKFFEAEIIYRKLLTIDSGNPAAWEGLGKALFGQKKYDAAEQRFSKALEFNGQSWATYEYLGLIASHRQEFQSAQAWFEQALQLQPDNETLLNNLAVSYYLNGNYQGALALFSRLAKTSDERKVHNNLALTYFKVGDYGKAMASFKRGAKSEAEAYNNLGYQYLVSRQFLRAIEAFERAIDLNPRYYIEAEKNLAIAKTGYAGGGNF